MPVVSCPEQINTCQCDDFPLLNLSAEAPDLPVYVGRFDGPGDPPINPRYNKTGCLFFCVSTVSQAAADACAQAQEFLCARDGDDPDCDDCCTGGVCGDWVPPGGGTYTFFRSQAVTVERPCPDPPGGVWFYTMPAGVVLSIISQADANARAGSVAASRARFRSFCPDVPKACFTSGEPYSFQLSVVVDGASPALPFELVSGALPPGFTLSTLGLLEGTPLMSGEFTFRLRVTEGDGGLLEREFTFMVAEITTASPLPAGSTGADYVLVFAQTGGTAPVEWALSSGSLPPGLSFDSAGAITGTPLASGTFGFTVEFTEVEEP